MFLEHGTPAERYSKLALELTKHKINTSDSMLLHLMATPHCRFRDNRVKEALNTGIFEHVHVRLYGDPNCATGFSANEWAKWMVTYPLTKFYIGLPPIGSLSCRPLVGMAKSAYSLLLGDPI
jgi:chitinase